MQLLKQKIIEELLSSLLKNVKSGNCNLSDDAVEDVVNAITAMNKNVYNITKRAACDKILHCATSTFELYRTMKLIPDGHHDYGSKELRWCENDFKEALAYRRNEQRKVID
jgi:hypothetical protein